MRAFAFVVSLAFASLALASGETTYTPPESRVLDSASPQNVRMFSANKDETWRAAIAYLSGSFFVMDQVLKDSDLINLSFSARDPRQFIECGRIDSWVKNLRGRRDYGFEAASPREDYEAWLSPGGLKSVHRELDLGGKINVLVSTSGTTGTRVRVTSRYVVAKRTTVSAPLNYAHPPQLLTGTLSFNTGEQGTDGNTTCQSNFALEVSILDGIAKELGVAP